MLQGQGAELHCLDLKIGHFVPEAQKQKGALVTIRSNLGTSLTAAGQPPLGRAWSREPGLSFWGGGKAWELGTGLGKRGAGGIRLDLGGMTICPGRKQRQRWLSLMEEIFNSSLGIWMGCGWGTWPSHLQYPFGPENLLLLLLTYLTRPKQIGSVLLTSMWTHCACTTVR